MVPATLNAVSAASSPLKSFGLLDFGDYFRSEPKCYCIGWQLRLPLVVYTDDGAMLTSCPKCHHLFVQHGGGDTNAPTTSLAQTETSAMVPEDAGARRCCPSVMTLHVPSCAMTGWTGGSVILQKGNSRAESNSPEPSPSIPLSFVLPTTPPVFMTARPEEWNFTVPVQRCAPSGSTSSSSTSSSTSLSSVQPLPQSEIDLQRLSSTLRSLKTSGWYYEGLSWQESVALLISTSPGTFLVRDSSNPRYLFSLSVQTERGPTSVRVHYSNGHFRLDAEPKLAPSMPQFECVVKLVEYYIKVTKNSLEHRKKRSKAKDQVWIDSTGQMYSHILLTRPLYQKERFPSLQHLSRLTVNKSLKNGLHVPTLSLPVSLNRYLQEYPHTR